jgi:hypothetical protein
MGPHLGMRQFIVPTKKWSAGKRLLEQVKYDMLQFMAPAVGKATLPNYEEMVRKAEKSRKWAPT